MKNGKFIGDTKGNRDMNHNLSSGGHGGAASTGKGSPSCKFIGHTKGNRDLPINRSSGAK